nr:thymidylate synthase [Comamonas thiooxydans]
MKNYDYQYEELLSEVRDFGRVKSDRTGTGTRSVFGHQMRFDLTDSFPLITTKKVHLQSVITELLWFLRGDTNVKFLQDNDCRIWNEWADKEGDLGPVYGKQWRSWDIGGGFAIDQIKGAIELLQNDPDSRRIIVSAWNVADLQKMALMPCHVMFQFYTEELSDDERDAYAAKHPGQKVPERRLSCQLYQRSADLFLGVPFNIASYSLLTLMMAEQVGMAPGEFIWTGGDCHVYSTHFAQVDEQISRAAPCDYPTMKLVNKPASIFEYTHENFVLEGYDPAPAIKAKVAV